MPFLLVLLALGGAIAFFHSHRTVIRRSISIDATPEEVFRVLDDPYAVPRFAPGVQSVSDVVRTDERVGDSFTVNYSILGLSLPTRFTLTRYNRNSRLSSQMEGRMVGTFDWTLSERAKGTDLAVEVNYQMQGGMPGRVVDALVIQRVNEKNAREMLENVKRLAERV